MHPELIQSVASFRLESLRQESERERALQDKRPRLRSRLAHALNHLAVRLEPSLKQPSSHLA